MDGWMGEGGWSGGLRLSGVGAWGGGLRVLLVLG